MIGIGSKLRDYEIVAHLRVGGMATLFLGRRQGAAGFAKLVAIKVIHPHLAEDGTFVSMFVDEALISARIDHPNVVHVEELGEVDGTKFLVMEYVHGASLSQLLGMLAKQGRRLQPELAVHIAVRVAEGLHAAHETGDDEGNLLNIVHRDVSPQNVLISSRGHVKLIDFGIAKARGRAVQTTSSSLKGKISYMSPEQAYGRALDRRSDVYALGVVLWEMLTVRRMFAGEDDFALLDQVRTPNVLPPSAYAPEVTPALDAAVMAALAPDVNQRLPTAQEFRRVLATAMPSALTLDSGDLASLLYETLGSELEAQRASIVKSAPTPAGSLTPPRDATAAGAPKPRKTIEQYTIADRRIKVDAAPDAWEPPISETSAPGIGMPAGGLSSGGMPAMVGTPSPFAPIATPPLVGASTPYTPAAANAAPPFTSPGGAAPPAAVAGFAVPTPVAAHAVGGPTPNVSTTPYGSSVAPAHAAPPIVVGGQAPPAYAPGAGTPASPFAQPPQGMPAAVPASSSQPRAARWAIVGAGLLCLGVGAGVLVQNMRASGTPVVTQLAAPIGDVQAPVGGAANSAVQGAPTLPPAANVVGPVAVGTAPPTVGTNPLPANTTGAETPSPTTNIASPATILDAGVRDAGRHRDGGRRRHDASTEGGGGTSRGNGSSQTGNAGGGVGEVPIVGWEQ